MDQTANQEKASFRIGPSAPGSLTLHLSGQLDVSSTGEVWREVVEKARSEQWIRVIIVAGELDYVDGAGIALLAQLDTIQRAKGGFIEIEGLDPKFRHLLEMFDTSGSASPPMGPPVRPGLLERIGHGAGRLITHMKTLGFFVGECVAALTLALTRPGRIRWKDVFVVAEKVGVNALPIIGLIGFLMGLIMSFQSAVTLRRFGAEIFVPNLLGLSIVRELGPLVTCILIAGRSGSAFAAELGTMKVNEEIDALTTMGLNPVRFLVVSRVLAALAMTPLLTVFFIFFSLVGGAVVMLSMDYPLITYASRVFSSLSMVDFIGGVFKAAVFSLFVAGIGCQRGLTTETGASAVGDSTTSAVVSGIILIAVVDGIFSVVYYFLGI